MLSRGPSKSSATISQAWYSQDGQLMAILGQLGATVLPSYDGSPSDLIGRRVRFIEGRWLLERARA